MAALNGARKQRKQRTSEDATMKGFKDTLPARPVIERIRPKSQDVMRRIGSRRPLSHTDRLALVDAIMADGAELASYIIHKARSRKRQRG